MIDYSLLYNFGLLAGRGKVVLNCTREALTTGLVTLLAARSTVLEILEDIEPDDEVVEACRKLRSMGYQISLDDYLPDQGKERLLPYADYIKIDFRVCDAVQRTAILRGLKNSPSVLIAEKVKDGDEFAVAMEEGFQLFQGYLFSRPKMFVRSSAIPARPLYRRLRAAVSQFPFDWHEVEHIVREDASLCYRIFRVARRACRWITHDNSMMRQVPKTTSIGNSESQQAGNSPRAPVAAFANRRPTLSECSTAITQF